MRKRAIRDGTFGSFDGWKGWDPVWDPTPKSARLTIPKEKKRTRTREQRAQKIQNNMQDMDAKIDQFRNNIANSKPKKSFEQTFKDTSKVVGR
eukprot:CAMPEP_0118675936 /NCGR_PEP_ID=MMETSP0800-20121206/1748_1 /TAXON_ID=210618 ORGANISM="Striatella unipunctata, Strain CCMP2910" /NCGR_SAMPLE_ID=MMETSP0800 /ASSEMBLY_ACC=CAM_ASM_000638 /LENGTH=92 /DNA_ID=CAMNT_0006571353 /DNA_START=216 /DNA_END=494 /DNA_ORIENTATION=-